MSVKENKNLCRCFELQSDFAFSDIPEIQRPWNVESRTKSWLEERSRKATSPPKGINIISIWRHRNLQGIGQPKPIYALCRRGRFKNPAIYGKWIIYIFAEAAVKQCMVVALTRTVGKHYKAPGEFGWLTTTWYCLNIASSVWIMRILIEITPQQVMIHRYSAISCCFPDFWEIHFGEVS